MEDRIQINGTWYVKEQPDAVAPKKEIEVYEYKGLVYEDSRFCFDATFDTVDNGKLYSIEVTDKRVKPWKEETWDSLDFFRGCLGRCSYVLSSLKGDSGFSDDDVENFIAFLKEIQKRGLL